jgi:succinate dehydrogenase / fumarate reductase membrane anchor subunit
MVKDVTGLTRSGLRDWLIQRVSAVVLAAYVLFLFGYIVCQAPLNFADWQGLYRHELMRIFTFLALLSLVYHTWVGIWTVLTDYVKCAYLRIIIQIVVILALVSYLVWGVDIVWGLQ